MPHQPTASNGGEGLRAVLEQCRDQFRFYEREHMAASKVDKASTNRTFADLADAALAPPVPRSEIEAAYWEATAHLDAPPAMTPEQRRLEDLKQMAAYAGPVVLLTVAEPYYLASCDGCGWVGSSEACGTDHMGDDSDVFCPRCQRPGCDLGTVANAIADDARRVDPLAPPDFLSHLRRVNTERYQAWVGVGEDAGLLFDATELGGEVGELLNVAKKLEREERGWRGSRAAPRDFADECADVLICLDKLARRRDVDLAAATVAKFNATSEKVGLPHRLSPLPIGARHDPDCAVLYDDGGGECTCRPGALDDATRSLVVAARRFWDTRNDASEESANLDSALEQFAASVPYEDQPDAGAHA